ncbi:MAG: hypothetical protein O7D86_01460 [Proteobacteria bacterium]|nr:hypothetical protein [Pseudomonadota bacterium]
MRLVVYLLISISTLSMISVNASDEDTTQEIAPSRGGTALTQEELDSLIGQYGEIEEIPEGFQFTEAEIKLWHGDHLANIKQPLSLYYEFIKLGTLEDGFSDSVYLKILELNEDGSKNAMLDFFTGYSKQVVTPDNVTNITGNPVLGIFLNGDVKVMSRLTKGNPRHFRNRIGISLREEAVVESTTFIFNGKEYQGEKIYFSPYLNDPYRRKFEKYADKYYEFIFSDDIPGSLYQIKTVIPDRSKEETAEPLILEILTLIDVRANES